MGAETAEDEAELVVAIAVPVEAAEHEESAAGRDLVAHPLKLVGHGGEREYFPRHRRVIGVAAPQAAHRGVDLLECRRRQPDDPVVALHEVLAQPDGPSARTIRRLECHWHLLPSCRRSLCCIICAARLPGRMSLSLLWFHAEIIGYLLGDDAIPRLRAPSPATAFDVALAFLSPISFSLVFLELARKSGLPDLRTILRRPPMVRWFAACAFIFILSMVAPPGSNEAFGQDAYPTRPVKFLVPYPGGGTNDVLARIVGDKLQAKWGQPVIIENRSGGSGNIGAALVAQAEPDGYTLLVSATPPLATNQSLYKELSYKPEEFVPITNFGSVPNLVIVRKGLPVNSLSELIAYAKASPGKLVYGSQGAGN